MLGWFQALMPREDKFFDLFERHAQVLVAGAGELRAALDGGAGLSARCARVAALEDEADGVAREVLLAVRRTFITPFDRGDIQGLISAMDDAIDQMRKTTKSISMFEVTEFDPLTREMGDLIVKAAGLTVDLVGALRQMRRDAPRISSLVEQMTALEDHSDQIHDQGIKALFIANREAHAMAFIVGSEIYGHLESVVDRFEDVAKIVSGILIEHI
jgi:uncharacterized protein Yka (UPF0111/DUF47 family)